MEHEPIMNQLRTIIAPYAKDQEALAAMTAETSFIRDLKVNSANLVDIVLDVEEAFNIEIGNDDMEQMLTVGAAIDIVLAKQQTA